MGTTVRITALDVDEAAVQRAIWRVHDLECRWSRFRSTSEISRLNAAGGDPCIVSPDTATLVHHMVRAHRSTHGVFDPTVLGVVEDLGYSQTWPIPAVSGDHPRATSPGCAGVTVDRSTGLVWLPPGVRLDPGGIGKGLAADLVARQLVDDGATGVLVDVGGDIRAIGPAPDAPAWRIGVEDPVAPTRDVAVVEITDGAVATSSRRRRRWVLPDGTAVHHVIDPRTGTACDVAWTSASALARSAVDAEVGATVVFVEGTAARFAPLLACLTVTVVDGVAEVAVGGDRPELVAPVGRGALQQID